MEELMKVTGLKITWMGLESIVGLMVEFTLASTAKIASTAKELTLGLMAANIKVNG